MSASDAVVISLSRPVSPDALGTLRSAAGDAVAAGHPTIVIDLDDVGVLDSAVIATLISILREARTKGASVSLRTGRKNILDTLRVTALDRVFTIVAPGERAATPVAVPVARKTKLKRFVAAFASGTFVAGLCGTGGSAASESPVEIVRQVVAQNAEMHSYQAQVSVDFHLRSFPYVSQHLDGTTYFKRPDNFEVVFDKVPSYAKGFDKLYSDIDDPTSWERRFDLSFVGEKTVDGHRDLVIRLVQKVRGMIDYQDVAIDPTRWRIDEMEWHYYNGGAIAMTQEYQQVGNFTVLAKQHATIRIPLVHAAADATYGAYRTNVAIDDSIFTREKH